MSGPHGVAFTVAAAEYWELLAAAQSTALARLQAEKLVTEALQVQAAAVARLAGAYGFDAARLVAIIPRNGQPDAPYTITLLEDTP